MTIRIERDVLRTTAWPTTDGRGRQVAAVIVAVLAIGAIAFALAMSRWGAGWERVLVDRHDLNPAWWILGLMPPAATAASIRRSWRRHGTWPTPCLVGGATAIACSAGVVLVAVVFSYLVPPGI